MSGELDAAHAYSKVKGTAGAHPRAWKRGWRGSGTLPGERGGRGKCSTEKLSLRKSEDTEEKVWLLFRGERLEGWHPGQSREVAVPLLTYGALDESRSAGDRARLCQFAF